MTQIDLHWPTLRAEVSREVEAAKLALYHDHQACASHGGPSSMASKYCEPFTSPLAMDDNGKHYLRHKRGLFFSGNRN